MSLSGSTDLSTSSHSDWLLFEGKRVFIDLRGGGTLLFHWSGLTTLNWLRIEGEKCALTCLEVLHCHSVSRDWLLVFVCLLQNWALPGRIPATPPSSARFPHLGPIFQCPVPSCGPHLQESVSWGSSSRLPMSGCLLDCPVLYGLPHWGISGRKPHME